MQIKSPCIITPRLLPGIKIGDSFLSIEYEIRPKDNQERDTYRIYLDTPEFKYTDADCQSSCGGGTLQEGLRAVCSFMSACGESFFHNGKDGENSDLYPEHVAEWCAANQEDLTMASVYLEENPGLIEE